MSARRGGFTLVELMIVLTLGVLVLGAAIGMLVQQEEAYGQMRAMAATQEDTRIGGELLSGELREISAGGGDLLWATSDSIRVRALRKFGIVCDIDKTGKRLIVAQQGVDPFTAEDSVVIYVDQDTLKATDDIWQREYVTGVSSSATCVTPMAPTLLALLPDADYVSLTLQGSGLKFDSVFPGAPVRQYETVTYAAGSWDGQRMLVAVDDKGRVSPLLGPLTDSDALVFRYLDGEGDELTSVPLDAGDRASVRRIRIAMRAQRWTSARTGMHRDSVITDIFLRGG